MIPGLKTKPFSVVNIGKLEMGIHSLDAVQDSLVLKFGDILNHTVTVPFSWPE